MAVRNRYADYLIRNEQQELAIEVYQEGLELDPDNVGMRYKLGLLYSFTGKHSQAIVELQRILRTADSDTVISKSQVLTALARAFIKMGHLDLAFSTLETAPMSDELCELFLRFRRLTEGNSNSQKCFLAIYGHDITFKDVMSRV